MVKKRTPRTSSAASGIDARDLWLAGLGAVSLTRKQSAKFYGTLVDEGKQFQGRVEDVVGNVQGQVTARVLQVRAELGAIVSPLRKRAASTLKSVRADVESRLAPVMDRLGLHKLGFARPGPTRKPASRPRAAAKRTVRNANATPKRAVRKASSTTKRAVRKPRAA